MRLIDAEQIGLTDFEIIMCDGNYKKALEILIDKIANAPTIIEFDGEINKVVVKGVEYYKPSVQSESKRKWYMKGYRDAQQKILRWVKENEEEHCPIAMYNFEEDSSCSNCQEFECYGCEHKEKQE